MVNAKFPHHLTICLLAFSFMVVTCSLEPTDQFIDRLTDTKQDALTLHKRPSFFVGSRYGRSGSSSSKTRRQVAPRSVGFFLGSRYGKRAALISEISTGTQLSSKPIPQQQQHQDFKNDFNTNHMLTQQTSSSSSSPPPHMSCVYTGLENYYLCNSIDSMFYFQNPALNYNNDVNEKLSTAATGADIFNNGHDDVIDDDDADNDNDDHENDKK